MTMTENELLENMTDVLYGLLGDTEVMPDHACALLVSMQLLYNKTIGAYSDLPFLNGIQMGLVMAATQPSLAGILLEALAQLKLQDNGLYVFDCKAVAQLYERRQDGPS